MLKKEEKNVKRRIQELNNQKHKLLPRRLAEERKNLEHIEKQFKELKKDIKIAKKEKASLIVSKALILVGIAATFVSAAVLFAVHTFQGVIENELISHGIRGFVEKQLIIPIVIGLGAGLTFEIIGQIIRDNILKKIKRKRDLENRLLKTAKELEWRYKK